MKVLGYSRRSERGWEYSQRAIALIAEFMTTFPDFIAGILRNPEGDNFQDTTFYPDPNEAKAKMKEIGSWLKSKEAKRFERVPLDAEQMDGDTVMAIEQAADSNNTHGAAVDGKRVAGVPRHALLKPSDAENRITGQVFYLGDRVVYVQDSGRVPIALRGTVVGLTRTPRTVLLDVVWDNTFMSGSSLGDRCSPFRGSTVPATSVLNLTVKQIIAESSATKVRQPAAPFTPLNAANGGYNAAKGSYGTGAGGQQLREANAPPPLQGSYRGAAAGNDFGRGRGRGGMSNGAPNGQRALPIHGGPPSRGRGTNGFSNGAPRGGAGNRGGYNVIDNSDPMEGVRAVNPDFTRQSYNNVAPPSNLDAGRGGRGRGRGRGAGFRGRGGPGRGRGRGGPAVDGSA